MKKFIKNYINTDMKFDLKTKLAIFSLIIVITGVFGFLYEFIFYYFNSGMKYFYWRGANFLPWINIYATGSLMIYFLAYKKRKQPLKVFLISVVSTGILELISGFLMYKLQGGIRCWDYNKEILSFGSIGGFVCLRSVLFFGVSSLFLMYFIIPFCFYLAKKLDKDLFYAICFSLCFIFLLDEFYNLFIARIFSLPRASTIYKGLNIRYMNYYY